MKNPITKFIVKYHQYGVRLFGRQTNWATLFGQLGDTTLIWPT